MPGIWAPTIFSAALTTHCRVFLSAAEQLSAEMKALLGFFGEGSGVADKVMSSAMCTPRNFVLLT